MAAPVGAMEQSFAISILFNGNRPVYSTLKRKIILIVIEIVIILEVDIVE